MTDNFIKKSAKTILGEHFRNKAFFAIYLPKKTQKNSLKDSQT